MSNEELNQETNRHSTGTYFSFSLWQITWTVLTQTMGLFLFFYYHTVIGLAPFWILVATGINTVWGAFNDPLMGYLTDKNFKWTRKWGRRFPWMVMGLIPWCVVLILIFSAPDAHVDPLPAFIWLLLMLVLNDLFMTVSDVHGNMLRADKFRTESERKKYSGFFGIFDMVAMAIGTAIPPLLIFGEGSVYYTIMAVIMAVLALICAIIFLTKGAREDKTMIDRYYAKDYEKQKFLKGTFEVLKQRSFLGFWLAFAGWGIATTMMTGMVAYVSTFVLQISGDEMTILLALMIVGGIISVPIWLRVRKKIKDMKKFYIFGSVLMCISLIPLTFFVSFIDLAVFLFFAGFAMGALWTTHIPILFSHVQDDFMVRTGKNQRGILIGAWAVLGLFTAFIDELLYFIVFTITGFKEGLKTYALLEAEVGAAAMIPIQWGIKFLVGVIPMIVLALGTIAFWKIYPLTQEKVMQNKAKLLEIGF